MFVSKPLCYEERKKDRQGLIELAEMKLLRLLRGYAGM
jgi:hypothetical protein